MSKIQPVKFGLFQVVCATIILLAVASIVNRRAGASAFRMPKMGQPDSANSAHPDPNPPVAAKSKPAASQPRQPATPPVGGAPGDLLDVAFDVAHDLSQVGNEIFDEVAGLTPREEQQVGKAVHTMIRNKQKLSETPETLSRIQRLAQPFLEARKRKEIEYHFSVIQDENINAFAHLGGYVYIHTGLLNVVRDDDELRFVLGHEIAHCDLRHCVQGTTAAVRAEQTAGELAGGLAAMAYRAIAVGYSEEHELASDRWGYMQMRRQGKSHAQAQLGLQMLQRNCPTSAAEANTRRRSAVKNLEDHFRTHPPIEARLAQLERLNRAGKF
ncbi:MAG: M48 family metalloprotease [Planctomycetaceae bacterium]|nr:M48 family metalloprotease [Planctomycetaceae bacterium]